VTNFRFSANLFFSGPVAKHCFVTASKVLLGYAEMRQDAVFANGNMEGADVLHGFAITSSELLFTGISDMADTSPLLPVTLTCNTDLKFIDLIQVVGGELLKHMSFTQEDSERIWLAIQEGIANAMRHGNKLDKSKSVSVTFIPSVEQIEIQISDQGNGVDLESVPNPNLPENLLKPNGRGVYFMKQVMDSVNTMASEFGSTLILIKHRRGQKHVAK